MSQPSIRIVARLSLLLAALAAARPCRAAEPAAKAPFSVRQIDVSDDAQLQTIVDREPGQYLGHPTTVLLEDGRTMIIVYPKGHGRGAIVMKRSTDGGQTWSARLPTPATWATSQEVPTIYRTVDQAGKKRLILFSGLYPIRRAVSEDDGATWSELEPIGDYGGIVACASCERLADGRYMALFHDDGRYFQEERPAKGTKPEFVVYKILSGDGGLTWSKPRPIAEHAEAHLCEPGLVRSPDGKQMAVLLRENSRKFRSMVIFSDDEEKRGPRRELPPELTGDRHVGKYVSGSNLFISFRDNLAGSPTYGDWVAWIGGYDDLVQGKPGRWRLRLMDNTKGPDPAYPAVDVLPDGTILATTYGHWTKDEMPYIVSVRLPSVRLEDNGDGVVDAIAALPPSPGGDSQREIPRAVSQSRPIYPPQLLRQQVGGTVELLVVIDDSGAPSEVSVWKSSNHRAFDDAAVEAARKWTFNPVAGGYAGPPRRVLMPVRFMVRSASGSKPDGSATATPAASAGPALEWRQLPTLSDPRGFAGQFVGLADDRLLLYGGTNFPETPVWAGGTKGWYRDAYVLDKPDGEWRKLGALDESRPVGYGVSLPTSDGKILCIGGADARRHYDSVFILGLDADRLTTTDLPKLPRPCAYSAGAILGGKAYVVGGIDRPDAVRALRTFWCLDLARPETGWQELPTWPGRGRMLATVAVDGEFLYLTGGCDLSSDLDGKPLRLYQRDTFRYSPAAGWQKLADAPVGIVAAPTPALVTREQLVVFGGDDSTNLGFRPPEKHPGFPNHVYAYDVRSDRWSRIGTTPFVPVATPLVKWFDGFVVASGEIRPGVRTREVWFVKRG